MAAASPVIGIQLWQLILAAVTALLLHAQRPSTVMLLGIVLLGIAAYAQFIAWPAMGGTTSDGLFTSHWMYGTLLLRAGTEALRGDGGPIRVHPALGGFAVVVLCVIAVHEIHVTHLHMFHNYVHILIYTIGATIAFSSCAEHVAAARCTRAVCGLSQCCARANEESKTEDSHAADAAARVRAIRTFADPACFFAMGLVLIGHEHDHNPLSVRFHTTFGYFLMTLAASIFLCALAHEVLPQQSPARATMRRLHAFAWLLTGGITMAMCVVKYWTPHGGFKEYLDATGIFPQTDFEEASTYIAATVLLCALHLALLHLTTPPPPPPPSLGSARVSQQDRDALLASWLATDDDIP